MKIIYLGEEIEATKEHELFSKNEFGFKVTIQNTKESWYPEKEEIIHNCTEVHNLWSLNYMGGASIAFESDIHRTGFTRRIDDIESVNIEKADKRHRYFRNTIKKTNK
jgi:hypothetical protein